MSKPTDLQVAQTIASQIGTQAFIMMGTSLNKADHEVVGDVNSLMFKIRGSQKYNKIKIELNAWDTYDITFYKIGHLKILAEHKVEGIYDDMLHEVIEQNTGLYLSLSPRR